MQKTINAKWSEITGNRKELDETIIGKGIEEQSLVNSDELNSIANRQDEMLDDLQRGNAWNIGKEYNQGDMVFVNVNYKRLSDSVGKTYKCFVICKQEKVKAEPFINKANKAIAFSKNYDYAVTQFIIQVDDDSTALTHFINDDFWDFVRLDNDLRNATRLNVSNEAKLGIQGKDSSIITFDRDIILNSNLDTKGTFDIKGNLTGGSLNSNNNIAWGSAFVKTPAYNAKGDEIVNAEWLNNYKDLVFVDYWAFVYNTYEKTRLSNRDDLKYRIGVELGVDVIKTKLEPKYSVKYTPIKMQIYKKFPIDFNIEMYNSLLICGKNQTIRENLVNVELIINGNFSNERKFNFANIYTPVSTYSVTNPELFDKFLNMPQMIQVDFSQSFEINTYEYFKNAGKLPVIQELTPYMYFSYVGEDNYNVISWDKDTRTLCLSWMQFVDTYLGCSMSCIIKLSTI